MAPVLGKANILTSAELVRTILYECGSQFCFGKIKNSFRHVGSLMKVDWFHPIIATCEFLALLCLPSYWEFQKNCLKLN